MSYYKKGKSDGKRRDYQPPSRDGLFGSSWFESKSSSNRRESYNRGHTDGEKEAKPKSWF